MNLLTLHIVLVWNDDTNGWVQFNTEESAETALQMAAGLRGNQVKAEVYPVTIRWDDEGRIL